MASLLFWFIVCLGNVYAIDLKDLKFLAPINSPDVLKEAFKNNLDKDEMTLCQKHSQLYFNQLQNVEGWAYKMFDAAGKIPDGLFLGSNHPPGSFKECLDIETPSLLKFENEMIEGFRGQYMSMLLIPESELPTDEQNRMLPFIPGIGASAKPFARFSHTGWCVPSSCTKDEIFQWSYFLNGNSTSGDNLMAAALNNQMKDQEIVLDSKDKVFIALSAFILIGIIIGTCMEVWFIIQAKKGNEKKPTTSQVFFLNFGLYANTKRLLNTDPPKGDHLACLDGMRALSIAWVMIGHNFIDTTFGLSGVLQPGLSSNPLSLLAVNTRFLFQGVSMGTISVDTFFLMSGCLVAYLMFKELDKTRGNVNFPLIYIHRYLRLTGTYAYLYFFIATVLRHCDTGPYHTGEIEADECSKNPWTNLLYFNNFNFEPWTGKRDGACLGQTWYLANDMQFFIIAPPIVYIIWKWKKIGLILTGTLIAASVAITSALTYHYGWGPIDQGSSEKDYMQWLYIKPWHRFGPYIIGILLGYILHSTKSRPFKMSKVANAWGWGIAIATGLAVVYGLKSYEFCSAENTAPGCRERTVAESVIFGGFHRQAWVAACAWVIFACCRGYGGWVNELLSWSGFIPFSKMSFIMYLTHMNVEKYIFGMYPSSIQLNVTTAVIFVLANMGYTAIISAIIFVCIELPWLLTEKLFMGLVTRPKQKAK